MCTTLPLVISCLSTFSLLRGKFWINLELSTPTWVWESVCLNYSTSLHCMFQSLGIHLTTSLWRHSTVCRPTLGPKRVCAVRIAIIPKKPSPFIEFQHEFSIWLRLDFDKFCGFIWSSSSLVSRKVPGWPPCPTVNGSVSLWTMCIKGTTNERPQYNYKASQELNIQRNAKT